MSNKKRDPHEPVRAINAETKTVKHVQHDTKVKTQGDSVVKWIFGILIALAIIFMIYSMGVVG